MFKMCGLKLVFMDRKEIIVSCKDEMTNMEKIRLCQEIVDGIQTENRQPMCRLQFSQGFFGITDSHIGGVPYLPRNEAYPIGEGGQPLWLCAQINFAQMPPMENFPKEGILQFFLSDWNYDGGFGLYSETDGTVQNQWRVCWYPEIDSTVNEAECLVKMPVLWADGTELWRTPGEPLKMDFLPIEQEGVNHEDFRFDVLFAAALKKHLPEANPKMFTPYGLWDETPQNRESPNMKALERILKQIECGGCKIGGYPRYLQDDPRLYGDDLPAWDILLFQLDDDTFTYAAGDIGDMALNLNGGTLNFLIRFKDLQNRDFSRVLAQWACT